ncbi:MAG: RAMP superfamily CRISPR-associated protein [Candidatus Aenigmatarchaeota archaeon]
MVKIVGQIKAKTPLAFSIPSKEEERKKPEITIFTETETKETRLIIPVNSLRGKLRFLCAKYFLNKLYEKTNRKIDYLTFLLYTSGGIVSKKSTDAKAIILPEKYFEVEKVIEKSIVLSLFGGTLPYPVGMIRGKLEISIPICDQRDISIEQFNFSKLPHEEEYFELIKKGMADSESYISIFEKVREKDGQNVVMVRNVIEDNYFIPEGVTFSHFIRVRNGREEELGLLLHGLRELSVEGIGGFSRFAFGKIAFNYKVEVNLEDERKDANIEIEDGEIKIRSEKDKWVFDVIKKVDEFYESLNLDDWNAFYYADLEKLIKEASKEVVKAKEKKEK